MWCYFPYCKRAPRCASAIETDGTRKKMCIKWEDESCKILWSAITCATTHHGMVHIAVRYLWCCIAWICDIRSRYLRLHKRRTKLSWEKNAGARRFHFWYVGLFACRSRRYCSHNKSFAVHTKLYASPLTPNAISGFSSNQPIFDTLHMTIYFVFVIFRNYIIWFDRIN